MLLPVAIVTVFLYICGAESISRTAEFPETQIRSDYSYHDNTKFVYARCNSSLPKLGKRCIAVSHFHAFENTTANEERQCEVTLKPESPNSMVDDALSIYNFGENKVLFVWMETKKASNPRDELGWSLLKTTVVHMLDNCRTFEARVHRYPGHPYKILDDRGYVCNKNFSVAAFEDTYAVILTDVIKNCSSTSECTSSSGVYEFDARGRKLSGPEYWPNSSAVDGAREVVPLEPSEPNKGYLIDNYNETHTFAEMMVKNNNTYQKLQLWKSDPSIGGGHFSLTNKAIGFCHIHGFNGSIFCWQSDLKGQIHMRKDILLNVSRVNCLYSTYNLREGGLLLATTKHRSCKSSALKDYYLMRANVDGQVQSLKVQQDTECNTKDNYIVMQPFENDDNQQCVAILCQSKAGKPSRLDTLVRCYSSDQFAKCDVC